MLFRAVIKSFLFFLLFIDHSDYEPPSLTCPLSTVRVYNDAGANTATVTWDFSFTDNSLRAREPGVTSDSFKIILTIDGENVDTQLPKQLEVSNDPHTVKYEVTDAAGNSAFCFFLVEVSGEITHTCSRTI